jgi:hypothetical protein
MMKSEDHSRFRESVDGGRLFVQVLRHVYYCGEKQRQFTRDQRVDEAEDDE